MLDPLNLQTRNFDGGLKEAFKNQDQGRSHSYRALLEPVHLELGTPVDQGAITLMMDWRSASESLKPRSERPGALL